MKTVPEEEERKLSRSTNDFQAKHIGELAVLLMPARSRIKKMIQARVDSRNRSLTRKQGHREGMPEVICQRRNT